MHNTVNICFALFLGIWYLDLMFSFSSLAIFWFCGFPMVFVFVLWLAIWLLVDNRSVFHKTLTNRLVQIHWNDTNTNGLSLCENSLYIAYIIIYYNSLDFFILDWVIVITSKWIYANELTFNETITCELTAFFRERVKWTENILCDIFSNKISIYLF